MQRKDRYDHADVAGDAASKGWRAKFNSPLTKKVFYYASTSHL